MSASPAPRANRWLDDLAAYKPGAHGGPGRANVLRLASNECPLGPNPKALAAAQASLTSVHRYADGAAVALRQAIAQAHGLDVHRIVCGTGSDEILQLCPLAFCAPGDEVIHAQYGFMVYAIAARRVGAVPIAVPEQNFTADVDAILAAVSGKTRIVFLANPNNPTGTRVRDDDIARLHAGLPSDVLLVLDGAYAEYVEDPGYDAGKALASSAPNVLMTRTFSKLHGLAGERIGWAYGPASVIDALNKIRGPFNVSTAGQAAAIASIEDAEWIAHVRQDNATQRSILFKALEEMGLKPIPGQANFILTQFPSAQVAGQVVSTLSDQGIYVRHLPGLGLADCIRIGVGTAAETQAFIAALKAVLADL
ncbi:MAG: histidinol-phosphate transaminase [Pseudomonadota bacterium]